MRLLESSARPTPRRGGAIVSVTAHVVLIALAVVATGNADVPSPAERVIETFYVAPRPPIAPTSARPSASTGHPSTAANPAPPTQVPDLATVPDVIPTAALSTEMIDPARGLFDGARGLGAERESAGTGTGLVTTSPLAAGEVDRQVVLVSAPRPRYPEALRAAAVAGRVVVRFVVDTVGRVERNTITVVSATHPLFAEAAERTVPALRFRAAEVRGVRVRQLVELPFDFSIERTPF